MNIVTNAYTNLFISLQNADTERCVTCCKESSDSRKRTGKVQQFDSKHKVVF